MSGFNFTFFFQKFNITAINTLYIIGFQITLDALSKRKTAGRAVVQEIQALKSMAEFIILEISNTLMSSQTTLTSCIKTINVADDHSVTLSRLSLRASKRCP